MDVGLTVAIVSLLGTALAGAVALVALIRQFPRRRLEVVTASAIALPGMLPRIEAQLAKFSNPYLLIFELKSSSRADIPSALFDAARPLVCRFERHLILAGTGYEGDIEWSLEGNEIQIPPQLIRRRSFVRIWLIVEDRTPIFAIENPLVDVPVSSVHEEMPVQASLAVLNPPRSSEERRPGFSLIELLVVVIIIGILAAIAIPIYIGIRGSLP